ncbi:rhythmically expressed gene 5 protein isoform X2 [Odontomachus brunneus]|uniref:rhythmically expressed gene 5 protein isoform X2 n=1 Tax=Odontomachus brunneus TaxID=486640 RepID=UPI0013F189A6|nr:rhythmically expressed gene 5 protein isoform X2 [Odontomachus brunneus]
MTSGTLILMRVTTCILLGCMTMRVTGSAIPMWEFLSRDEKMSHLYELFSKQVTRFCADSSRPDCNKNLLVSGIRSLAGMDDNVLDKLDPYQRGAKDMIWHAMVGSNRFSSRISHESADESYFTTGADLSASSGSETNGLGEESMANSDYVPSSEQHSGPYLVGPMVIRVYPDGRPVPEDQKRPLPRDEDVDELRFSRLPSVEEIEARSGSTFYGKGPKEPVGMSSSPSYAVDEGRRRQQAPSVVRFRGEPLPYERRAILRGATMNERGLRYY